MRSHCLCCVFTERKFLVAFGFIYTLSVLGLFHHSYQPEEVISVHGEWDSQGLSKRSEFNLTDRQPLRGKLITRKAEEVPSAAADDSRVLADRRAMASRVRNKTSTPKSTAAVNDCDTLPKPKFMKAGTLPLTALSSFPGSGNTWMRVLLSSLTGINTGDIYKDGSFAKTPGFSNRKDDTVIAIKTHHPFWDDRNGPDPSAPKGRYWERAIVIVRHPLDATISGFSFFKTRGSHTKTATVDKFIQSDGLPTKEWKKWAHDQIRNWGRCIEYWVNIFQAPLHLVFYENLKDDLAHQLIELNSFLDLPLNTTRLNCTLLSNTQKKFKRPKTIDKRVVYDTSMLNEVEIVLEKTKQLLLENYSLNHSHFHWPDSYAANLVRENFSVRPT